MSLRDRRGQAQLIATIIPNSSKHKQLHSPGPRTSYSEHVGPSTVVQPGRTGFFTLKTKRSSNKSHKTNKHAHRYRVSLPSTYQHPDYVHFSRRAPKEYTQLKRRRSMSNTFFSKNRPLSPQPSALTRQSDPNFSRKTNFGELCLDMLDHRVEDDELEIVSDNLDESRLSASWKGMGSSFGNDGLQSPNSPKQSVHRTMSQRELNYIRPMTAKLRTRSAAVTFQGSHQAKRRPLSASASSRTLRSIHTHGAKQWAPRHHHPQILGRSIQTSKGRRKISKIIRHIPSHRSSTNTTKYKTSGFVSPISTRNIPSMPVNITRGMILAHQGM
tara:strand:+ start:84 stop:1067 length:984 start_codon:yes stop_codon:yes gene_type:complete